MQIIAMGPYDKWLAGLPWEDEIARKKRLLQDYIPNPNPTISIESHQIVHGKSKL